MVITTASSYQRGLASMIYKFFDKKTGSRVGVNEELAQEQHKSVIKKPWRKTVYTRFKDNIWAPDSAEMGSLSSRNQGFKYLLCVIDVLTKYAWVKSLTNKKAKTVLYSFVEIVKKSKIMACSRKRILK